MERLLEYFNGLNEEVLWIFDNNILTTLCPRDIHAYIKEFFPVQLWTYFFIRKSSRTKHLCLSLEYLEVFEHFLLNGNPDFSDEVKFSFNQLQIVIKSFPCFNLNRDSGNIPIIAQDYLIFTVPELDSTPLPTIPSRTKYRLNEWKSIGKHLNQALTELPPILLNLIGLNPVRIPLHHISLFADYFRNLFPLICPQPILQLTLLKTFLHRDGFSFNQSRCEQSKDFILISSKVCKDQGEMLMKNINMYKYSQQCINGLYQIIIDKPYQLYEQLWDRFVIEPIVRLHSFKYLNEIFENNKVCEIIGTYVSVEHPNQLYHNHFLKNQLSDFMDILPEIRTIIGAYIGYDLNHHIEIK